MNPSVGKVEAFGLLAGDVWAPERPSYLYNTFFNMAGSHPFSFVEDVVEREVETDDGDDGVEWSHLVDLIDVVLVEDYSDDDEAVTEEPTDKDDNNSTVDGDVVLPEFTKPDDAAFADGNSDDPADDGKATGEETLGTMFCFTTAAVAVHPAVVSASEDCGPAKGARRRRPSSSTQRRGGRRKKAPSLALGAGNGGESCSTAKLDTACADARKGLAGGLGGTTAEAAAAAAAAAAPPRRSTARSARGQNARREIPDGSGKLVLLRAGVVNNSDGSVDS